MKKLLSIKYTAGAFNIAMFLIRICLGGGLLLNHGLTKIQHFDVLQSQFYNFMGMGPKTSLILDIFAEAFCSIFIIIGLFTRILTIPLIIAMLVVIFGAQAGKPWAESELAILYLFLVLVLLLCGPGKASVDAMISK